MSVKFVVLILAVSLVSSAPPDVPTSLGNTKNISQILGDLNLPLSFQLVGVSDTNKFFFADGDGLRTWYEARAHCEAFNLQLPSIKTMNESQVVGEGLSQPNYVYNYYWTSATEHRDISLLKWEHGKGEGLDASVINEYRSRPGDFFCGVINFTRAQERLWKLTMHGTDCQYKGKTLCELQL